MISTKDNDGPTTLTDLLREMHEESVLMKERWDMVARETDSLRMMINTSNNYHNDLLIEKIAKLDTYTEDIFEATKQIYSLKERLRLRQRDDSSCIEDALFSIQPSLPRSLQHLPTEILRIVIFFATVVPTFADTSISRGPSSLWCRTMQTRRNIPLVCKAWHDISIEFLYQDIVIRHPSQLFCLARTMEGQSSLGFHLRTFSLQCIVESADFNKISRAVLGIVNLAPRIDRINLSNPFWSGYRQDSEYAQEWTALLSEVATLNSSSPSITHLELAVANGTRLSFGFNPYVLQQFRKLTSLDINVTSLLGGNSLALAELNPNTGFCLPEVRRFRFSTFAGDTGGIGMLPPLMSCMPHLSILIFSLPYSCWYEYHGTSQLLDVIRQIGPKLTTFYIQNTGYPSFHRDEEPISFDIQRVLDVCPRLEHLTVPISLVHGPLSHTALRWLDICSFPENWSQTNPICRLISHQENCPQLVSLRHIDNYLVKSFLDLTLEFPPYEVFSTPITTRDSDSDSDIRGFERKVIAVSNTEYAILTPHKISRYDPWSDSEDESFVPDDGSTDDASDTSTDSEFYSDVSSEGGSRDWVLEV